MELQSYKVINPDKKNRDVKSTVTELQSYRVIKLQSYRVIPSTRDRVIKKIF